MNNVNQTTLSRLLNRTRTLQATFDQVADTNISSTASFIYESQGAPLRSTQQLNVDWSSFENHTFFMPAEAKVNVAFEQIINKFPFDGRRTDVEKFLDDLGGFERWVFDEFPKYKGELSFSGSVNVAKGSSRGAYIIVNDCKALQYDTLSSTDVRDADVSVLNPNTTTSLTLEMQLFIPDRANDVQIVCQKANNTTQGYTLYISSSTASDNVVSASFCVTSGSLSLCVSAPLTKGVFNHVAAELDKSHSEHRLLFFVNDAFIATSRTRGTIGKLAIDANPLSIGTGSQFVACGQTVVPKQTLSGTLDEFRLFHSARSLNQLKQNATKAIYPSDDLKLYFKFNEPQPPLVSSIDNTNAIVIDSSGNALHSTITNFYDFVEYDTTGNVTASSLRVSTADDVLSNMTTEQDLLSPVLFPANTELVSLSTRLLASASIYDAENPNIITRLIPQHYLLESDAQGDVTTSLDSSTWRDQITSTQLLLSLLYVWARHFDELKLFVDAFGSLNNVQYNTYDTVADTFLLQRLESCGFNVPSLFNDALIEQFIDAESVSDDNVYALKFVQNELLRRVLINLPDIIRSKGTQHSIKAFLRTIGIDPENSVRIREHGGPTERTLSYTREHKREQGTMLQFVSSSFVTSPYLSSSRTEPGDDITGFTVWDGTQWISNNPSDGLLTSGSWSAETTVKWTPSVLRTLTSHSQSLLRLNVTGTCASRGGVVLNLVAISSSIPRIVAYVRPGNSSSSPLGICTLLLDQGALFDGQKWNIVVGCCRNDQVASRVSSSYFIRAGRSYEGDIEQTYLTSSYLCETQSNEYNVFRSLHTGCGRGAVSGSNCSGSYMTFGQSQQIVTGSSSSDSYLFLNDTENVSDAARVTNFDGRMSHVRFWSRALSEDEWLEHVRNYKSTGVNDPKVNYNFNTTSTGSFGRLRLNSIVKQTTRTADNSGNIRLIDDTLNVMHLEGSGFKPDAEVLLGETFGYSYLSPNFDEAITDEKTRIRSFYEQDMLARTPWAQGTPVYEVLRSETPTDDTRFSVEFSLVDALNRDIVLMFSTFDAIESAIGNPELMFSTTYPDLERLQSVYFNRLQEKLNFKAFFDFYRWFDMSIGTFIEQLVPKKTSFNGLAFTVESHLLERHKLEYKQADLYVGESNRSDLGTKLLLQVLDANVHKF